MEQNTNEISDVVIETDLIGWDPRSIEVFRKYGLSKSRFDSYMRLSNGRSDLAECQYLVHRASDISSNSMDKHPEPIEEVKEARDILVLARDRYDAAGARPGGYVLQMIKMLEENISGRDMKEIN